MDWCCEICSSVTEVVLVVRPKSNGERSIIYTLCSKKCGNFFYWNNFGFYWLILTFYHRSNLAQNLPPHERAVLNGHTSTWPYVLSGVPQGTSAISYIHK